jgi:hypothetical protein
MKHGETLTNEEESNAAKTTAGYASWCVPYILTSARAAFRLLSFGTDVTRLLLQVFDSGPCMWLRKVAKGDGFEYVAYVDDTLALNHRKMNHREKEAIRGITEFYSSADVDKTRLPDYQEWITNWRSTSRTNSTGSS